jgi:hypothetical protein
MGKTRSKKTSNPERKEHDEAIRGEYAREQSKRERREEVGGGREKKGAGISQEGADITTSK